MGKLIALDYRPRRWARPFHASTKRFAAIVLHRRAGKTVAVLNHHQRAALDDAWERQRLRTLQPDLSDQHITDLLRYRVYAHILPTYRQAKLTSWEHFKYYAAKIVGAKVNESELRIDYPCPKGHLRRVQLFGADDPDKLRGASLAGCSLDEYGQHPPHAFGEVLSKALADHLGYAIFAGTIKGKNQLYRTWKAAAENPAEWFSLWQDIDVSLATEDDASAVVLRQAYSDDMRLVQQGLMSQEEFDQEWHLSTEAAIRGAYYARQMAQARQSGRLTRVPYDPALPVDTDWDLGIADKMTIWFSQSLRTGEVRLVDYYQNSDHGIEHYAGVLRDKGYVYGRHWAPHDINVRELGTGKSRLEVAQAFGIRFEITPRLGVADGIDAVRRLLPRCWFDEQRCEAGIEALTHYRKGWDERLQQFKDEPEHDWACVSGDTEVATRAGVCRIDALPPTGEVATLCGWKRYENPRITRRAAPLVAVTFDDGLTVRCTPEHRFLTVDGWRFAEHLRPGSLIQSASTPWSSTSTAGSTVFGRRSDTSVGAALVFIETCGRRLSARFQRATTFITETATRATTAWRTLSACRPAIIFGGTPAGAALTSPPLPAQPRPSGIGRKRAAHGIVATLVDPRDGRNGSGNHGRAIGAAPSSRCWFARAVTPSGSVPSPARPRRISRVEPLAARADVWCLTVPDGHAWPLANGAMVHNSHGADAFRGLAVRHQPPEERKVDPFEGGTYGWTGDGGHTGWMS